MSFHFLRPEWLWLLLPTAWILWTLWRLQQQSGQWQQLIDPAFQTILLGNTAQQSIFPWRILGLAFIWLTLIIAAAGPTWQTVEQPAHKSDQANVILLDLSLSMLADDLKPNRISRAKYKLTDLLKKHPELSAGLVGYSGSAHALTPVSEDNQTLLSLMKTLSPEIMPAFGSDAIAGVEKAIALIKGSHAKQGHLIWILDDIESDEIAKVAQRIKQEGISVSLLAVGTPNGGPINMPNYGLVKDDQGKIVVAKLPFVRLQQLATKLDGSLTLIQNNDEDLKTLLPPMATQSTPSEEDDKKLKHWLDNGIYFLAAFLPFMAFVFRRGWLFTIGCLLWIPGLVIFPQPSIAADKEGSELSFLEVFKSPDQQGYEKWQKKDYEAALDRFESPQWKGASLYRLKQYQEAIKQFKTLKTPEARFNQGNALAQLGEFEAAKEQYQQALATRPNWQAAQDNLQLIEQLLKQQQQQNTDSEKPGKNQQATPQQSSQQNSKQADHGANDLNQSPQNQQDPSTQNQQSNDQSSSDKQNSQQSSAKNNQKSPGLGQDKNADNQQNQDKDTSKQAEEAQAAKSGNAKQDKEAVADGPASQLTEEEQAENAWLNQIPDDPSVFIKRKFEYQYQQQQTQSEHKQSNKIW